MHSNSSSPRRPAIFGKVLGELAAQLAQVRELAVVIGEEPLIQGLTLPGRVTSETVASPRLEVQIGAQKEPQRQRLRPQLGLDQRRTARWARTLRRSCMSFTRTLFFISRGSNSQIALRMSFSSVGM